MSGFSAPLIVMLTKRNDSSYTRGNAVEALNFQITVAIGYAVALVLSFVVVGVFLLPVLFIANIAFCVKGADVRQQGHLLSVPGYAAPREVGPEPV